MSGCISGEELARKCCSHIVVSANDAQSEFGQCLGDCETIQG